MSNELKYYPNPEHKDQSAPYYVEFDRGDRVGEFTLFRRQWFRSEEEINHLAEKNAKSAWALRLGNECHPWNIFTGQYGQDGCIPDKAWVCWMVDALNAKFKVDRLDAIILKSLENKTLSQ